MLVSAVSSCTIDNSIKKETVYGIEQIVSLKEKGITVESYSFEQGTFCLYLSDESSIVFNTHDVSIATIDERGYWCVNGELSTIPLDQDVIVTEVEKSEIQKIIENYTEWLFFFNNGEMLSLEKLVFNLNADSILRGVNHRGFNSIAPENTLPAYRLSRLKGFCYVETDVQFTADGVPVIIHDATIDRTSNAQGKVTDLTWDQLRELDFGIWKSHEYQGTKIPSLEEFLLLCKTIGLIPYLEIKAGSRQQVHDIVSMVESCGLKGRVVYISFGAGFLRYVAEVDPDATLGFLYGTPLTEEAVNTALTLKNDTNAVFIDCYDCSEGAVSLCRNAFLPMEVWTINSETTIRNLPSYITGVTSDKLHAGLVVIQMNNNS